MNELQMAASYRPVEWKSQHTGTVKLQVGEYEVFAFRGGGPKTWSIAVYKGARNWQFPGFEDPEKCLSAGETIASMLAEVDEQVEQQMAKRTANGPQPNPKIVKIVEA